MKKILLATLALFLLASGMAAADDASWLQLGGDYRFRYDRLKGTVPEYLAGPNSYGLSSWPAPGTLQSGYEVKNDALFINRFGLNVRADALEDVMVKARFVMYKVWGQETSAGVTGNYFADRLNFTNDATVGVIPEDSRVRVDYAYATVSNLFGAPAWFSVGRRPTTGGVPGNIRKNSSTIGTAGFPSILVDYAFDGATFGYAPDIESLPGSYALLAYGSGFNNGYQTPASQNTSLKNTDFLGASFAFMDNETAHIAIQYQRLYHVFDKPYNSDNVTANLGDIDWTGGLIVGKAGGLNIFLSAAQSKTKPKGQTASGDGLLFTAGSPADKRTGYVVYAGGRYDFSTGTKIGVEYNHGSKYWVGIVPAGDDIWTSKLGARGDVYEIYFIQELNRKPISKNGKAFARIGYQYYSFDYTGSNSWLGAPAPMADVASVPQALIPIKDARDIYLTFDVLF